MNQEKPANTNHYLSVSAVATSIAAGYLSSLRAFIRLAGAILIALILLTPLWLILNAVISSVFYNHDTVKICYATISPFLPPAFYAGLRATGLISVTPKAKDS